MEGAFGFIGFSLGASLGMAIVRTATGGLRPLMKGAIKAGLAVGDTVQGVGRQAGDALATATSGPDDETQRGSQAVSELEPARSRRRARSAAQKIEIATE